METDHLPECPYDPRVNAAIPCICDRLRACKQRVLFDVQHRTFQHAWNAGVTAARDAVAALDRRSSDEGWFLYVTDILAAIDNLRGEA